ncbi:sulfotransferase family protein [Almyronema epifaneia]|uniref:Sulfotransferase family protein n=1 Tax=Almyronema epifaneia S1 TaxID=2991925 RepID=A0ABW6IC01_9CYAN
MGATIKSRIFLVGCPRSGTTLLQSLLAAHSDIQSFPETHFFSHLYPATQSKRRKLGLAAPAVKEHLKKTLQTMGKSDLIQLVSPASFFCFQYINAYIKILDQITLQSKKSFWLEKTPKHLHYVNQIESAVPNCKFLHIVRDGVDVIKSLYAVTRQFPQSWDGPWTLEKCTDRWINDYRLTMRCATSDRHLIVHYQNLVEDTVLALEKIFEFIEVPFEVGVLEDYRKVCSSLILTEEVWKNQVQSNIENIPKRKAYTLSKEEEDYVVRRLKSLTLDN